MTLKPVLHALDQTSQFAKVSNTVFAVVREMSAVPFAKDDVARLLIATVAPIVPLLLTIMPFEQLLTQVVKIIF
jgi:hypothetical protein